MRLTQMHAAPGGAAIPWRRAIGIPAGAMAARAGRGTGSARRATCTPADLDVWAGVPSNQGLEQNAFQIQLSDISARPCTLDGFPECRRSAARAAARRRSRQGEGTPVITLRYWQTAHFTLDVITCRFSPQLL